jgi:hypothetical protein
MVRPSPLALWHLLSLDAPTVTALWTVFVARCAGITLPWTLPAAMFVAVWIIYAADRLLDGRAIPTGNWQTGTLAAGPDLGLEERHSFHHRHYRGFLVGILISSAALIALLPQLDPRALQLYALLAALLAAWMLLVHLPPFAGNTPSLPKEFAVGVFFSAAVFIPTVARAPTLRPALLPDALLAAAACTLNCLFLYAWEHPGARAQAHWTTRWSTRHLPQLAVTITVVATLTAWLTRKQLLWMPALACALSAVLLLLLHRLRHRLSSIHLRACADLALLTPLLFLLY